MSIENEKINNPEDISEDVQNETYIAENTGTEEASEIVAEEAVSDSVADNSVAEEPSEAVSDTVEESVEDDGVMVIPENAVPDSDFIEDFTPTMINIPNYNKEKEQKKREKASIKAKKSKTKKSRRRRRLIKKIINITRNVVLFILLLAISIIVVSSLIVRGNTSKLAIEGAIKDYGPERISIGEVEDYSKMSLAESSEYASVADILKDNAEIPVSYAEIEQNVENSTYPTFIAEVATSVVRYYVFADYYERVTKADISKMLYDNASKIEILTGKKLSEKDCSKLAGYIVKSYAYKEIDTNELNRQKAAGHTPVTSVLFSLPVLIGMVVAFMLIIVLIVMTCKGFSHKLIGWAIMISGMVSGIWGFVLRPMFKTSSKFVSCIIDAIMDMFNRNSLIYGAVTIVVGLLVLLIGSAIIERSEDEYDEDELEYIEELEQLSENEEPVAEN